MTTKPILPIYELDQRHSGVTKAIADTYAEAASVCLDRHHQSPIDMNLDCDGNALVAIAQWQDIDTRTEAAWANKIDTTEFGAYACALGAVELLDGLVAVRRAETLTGADYYVAPQGAELDDLEDCLRLEVSGVDQGSSAVVRQRLVRKLSQAARGDSNLPARAAVVGFMERIILMADL